VKERGSTADTMNPSIIPRDQVAEHLTVSTSTLLRLEGRGLIHPVQQGDVEGYGPAEIRRLWTIVTFQRDLGINLAGIEVILRLRDQMKATQDQLDRLAETLRETLDREPESDTDG
jgi:MerR family transcriptional regulator, heat shock protein HspR